MCPEGWRARSRPRAGCELRNVLRRPHASPLADLHAHLQQEAKAKTGLQTDWPDLKGLPQHRLIGKDGKFFSLPPFLAPQEISVRGPAEFNLEKLTSGATRDREHGFHGNRSH